jgi:hypothetical protein
MNRDLLFVVMTLAMFALMFVYVWACEHLK